MKYQEWMMEAANLLTTMTESRDGGLAPGRAWDNEVRALLRAQIDSVKPPPATDERWHAYALAGIKALADVGAAVLSRDTVSAESPDDMTLELAAEATRFADAMLEAAERQAATGKGAPHEGA